MPLDLVQVEALDMSDLAHDLDQWRRDQTLAEPRRQYPRGDNQDREPYQQVANGILHRPEEFRLWNDRDERPSWKRDRGQDGFIGLAVPRQGGVKSLALVAVVARAGLPD